MKENIKKRIKGIGKGIIMFLALVMIWGTVQIPVNAEEIWIDSNPVEDYDFSFAVVGDTQTLTWAYPDKYVGMYDWIVDNVDDKGIKFVFGLGDVTEKDLDYEWKLAKENIEKLNGVVPYSVIRGNHDSTKKLNEYFPYKNYEKQIGGSYDGLMNNTWRELIVGDLKYLIVTLDYGPSTAVLKWAGDIIAEHPNHNVIVTTHGYLYKDGTTLDKADSGVNIGENNGDGIWDKLISKYENIVLVLCGHVEYNKIVMTKTKGDNGNMVTQMLINPQIVDKELCGTGLVAMLYFSEGGSKVQVQYYSTAKDKYYLAENQFTTDLAVVEPGTINDSSFGNAGGSSTGSTSGSTSQNSTSGETGNTSGEENSPGTGDATSSIITVSSVAIVSFVVIVLIQRKRKAMQNY